MPEYITKLKSISAFKWLGHGKEYPDDFVKIQGSSGVSGYGAKLGYYLDHKKNMKIIRPNEYIMKKEDGSILTMDPVTFESEFEASPEKRRRKRKDTSDVVDNSEVSDG